MIALLAAMVPASQRLPAYKIALMQTATLFPNVHLLRRTERSLLFPLPLRQSSEGAAYAIALVSSAGAQRRARAIAQNLACAVASDLGAQHALRRQAAATWAGDGYGTRGARSGMALRLARVAASGMRLRALTIAGRYRVGARRAGREVGRGMSTTRAASDEGWREGARWCRS